MAYVTQDYYLKDFHGEAVQEADFPSLEERAAEIIEEFSEYLGKALAIFACVADPEIIVLGGGVSKAGEVLIQCVEEKYQKYAFSACRAAKFALATLGNDAGVCGAAKMILSK